jgi:putative hemolysin
LWGGITELLVRARLTYMLGCVSLEERNPKVGWAIYEYFLKNNLICKDFFAIPRPGFKMDRPPERELKKLLSDEHSLRRNIPALFKGYLRLGALICGEPALDREFGTTDFFILVDIGQVPPRYKRHFNYRNGKG